MSHSQHAIQNSNTTGKTYFAQSYAKINLTLDVLGRRPDGYHELVTVMQTIDLADTICLTALEDDCVRISCTRSELSNDENLAVRAAQVIRKHLGLKRGLAIELDKRIPVAAGLGGGSSNAATMLHALQRWWALPLTAADLHSMAAELGSDVPFFLSGGLALCEGRGEQITPLEPRWPTSLRWLLLVKPAIGVSTPVVFRNLPTSDYTQGDASRNLITALQTAQPIQAEYLHNGLERGVLQRYPEVAQAYEAILHAGAPYVRLSGSGPTLFAPFSQLVHAAQVRHQLHAQGYEVFLTRAVNPGGDDIQFF